MNIDTPTSMIARILVTVLARTRGGAKVWDADRGYTADTAPVTIHHDAKVEPGYPYIVSLHGRPACYAVDASEALRLAVLTVAYA